VTSTLDMRRRISFGQESEKVLAVHAAFGPADFQEGAAEEIEALVQSAGGSTVGHLFQHRHFPDPASFVGSGKVEEIAASARSAGITTLVFDANLSPGQVSRLEEATGCKVIDRTELILTIFALHARTAEAKLQIELAQLRYALPRLTGMWHHFSRLGGGIGTRGPGETQLEVDRRSARKRIRLLEEQMEAIEKRRVLSSERRQAAFQVALVGYTNAGKSTLMNSLCNAGVATENRLFATLDTVSRRLRPEGSGSIILSDTVGFIDRLPEELIASFRSTLAAVREADLLLVVGDLSHPWRDRNTEAVRTTLEEVGAGSVPRIMVWNKIDIAPGSKPMEGYAVSALTGEGLGPLVKAISRARDASLRWFTVELEQEDGSLLNWLHENTSVRTVVREGTGVRVVAGSPMPERWLRARLSESPGGWRLLEAAPPAGEVGNG
jgi:GTP-binding protein HflX